jgi:hypothetical protein
MKCSSGFSSMVGLSLRAIRMGTAATRMTQAPTTNGIAPSLPSSENSSGPAAKPSDSTVA